VLAGLALGGAVLVRPIGLVIWVPAIVVALALVLRKSRSAAAFAFVAAAMLLPSLWVIRNGVVGGYWGISKTGMSYVSSVYGSATDESGPEIGKVSVFDHHGTLSALRDVTTHAAHRPGEAVVELVHGTGMVLVGPGEWAMRRHFLGEKGRRGQPASPRWLEMSESANGVNPPLHAATPSGTARSGVWALVGWSWLTTLAMYVLTGIGVVDAIRRRRRTILFLLAGAVLLVLASAGYQANARFRVPVVPLLLLTAARPDVDDHKPRW
jgi:hypothetical protein